MRANENLVLVGEKVVLVPYRKEHVARYHEWMKSPELLESTASEPLSIEEEYAMQISWHTDDDKCTFIVLERGVDTKAPWNEQLGAMIGDVNFFLNDHDDPHAAEAEIMIAEKDARGKGLGIQALSIMMQYGAEDLGLTTITSKIGLANTASLALFEKKMGFTRVSESAVFQEATLSLPLTEDVLASIKSKAGPILREQYDPISA